MSSGNLLSRLRDRSAGAFYQRPIQTDRWGLQIITPPASEPVTLEEAKAFMRVDLNSEDALITALITAARNVVELHTRRALIQQTLKLTFDCEPEQDFVELPRPGLLSLISIKYFRDDDVEQDFDITQVIADVSKTPAVIRLKSSSVWPTALRPQASLVFNYNAGFGADASFVPDPIKTAVKTIVAAWFEQRGQMEQAQGSNFGDLSMIPGMAVPMLAQYRVHTL